MTHRTSMLSHRRRQSGLSMFGVLMLLIVLAIVMNVGLTLGPHYMDNRSLTQVIETLDPGLVKGGSKTRIHTAVNKGLKVNSIRTLKSEDIVAIKNDKKKGNKLMLDYEIRENIFANVDVVLVFHKEFGQ